MYVRVVVYPGAKKEIIKQVGEHRFEIMVKEPAAQNLANNRVREIIAREYGLALSAVRIIAGHHSSRKIFSLRDE